MGCSNQVWVTWYLTTAKDFNLNYSCNFSPSVPSTILQHTDDIQGSVTCRKTFPRWNKLQSLHPKHLHWPSERIYSRELLFLMLLACVSVALSEQCQDGSVWGCADFACVFFISQGDRVCSYWQRIKPSWLVRWMLVGLTWCEPVSGKSVEEVACSYLECHLSPQPGAEGTAGHKAAARMPRYQAAVSF